MLPRGTGFAAQVAGDWDGPRRRRTVVGWSSIGLTFHCLSGSVFRLFKRPFCSALLMSK